MKAPPEVASQMVREASRSISEVTQKEEKRQSQRGRRLMLRVESKGILIDVASGALSHRHKPNIKALELNKFSRPRRIRMISLE